MLMNREIEKEGERKKAAAADYAAAFFL